MRNRLAGPYTLGSQAMRNRLAGHGYWGARA
jgi:hypothetical protein